MGLTAILLLLTTLTGSFARGEESGSDKMPVVKPAGSADTSGSGTSLQFEPYYLEVMEGWREAQIPEAEAAIVIKGSQVLRHSEGAGLRIERFNGRDNALVWINEDTNWIEYEVPVDQPGLYEIVLHYHSYKDAQADVASYRPAMLSVSVDGAFPFREARALKFPRHFRDTLPLQTDEKGDHLRPKPIEIENWYAQSLRDTDGAYAEPFQWHFTKGKHTLRLQGYESIVIDKIELKKPEHPLPYKDAVKQLPEGNGGKAFTLEAELMAEKDDVALQIEADQDAFMTPFAGSRRIFNAVGGKRWSSGGAGAAWTFTVPASGRYKIGMRAYQGYLSNQLVFRKILIDGKVPYEELLSYPFPYSTGWQGIALQGENDEPYSFYLEQGEHTLSMETTYDPFNPIVKKQEAVSQVLTKLSLNLNSIVGGQTDQYRTWNIEQNYPELLAQLREAADEIEWMAQELLRVNGRQDNNSQTLATATKDIRSLLSLPNEVPNRLDELTAIQNKVSSIRTVLANSPLMLDKFYFIPVEEDFPRMKATVWQKLRTGIKSFIHSFNARDRLSYGDSEVVHVWANYGRDYVNVLQDMADQYFTPETGIKVKVDLLPREQLLVLANAAGKAPDVAIGMTEGRPIEMAIRGAVEDLSQYPGFDAVFNQFSPGAMIPYYYNGGYYALPETQRFNILYYRKDILDLLGLQVPQTWDDVIAMLPALQQSNYNFYIPADFQTFFFQNGAEYYTTDGMKTELDSPEALRAFQQLTDMFTIYGIDQQVTSFYQHFRDGTMPIGIADFNMYLQMTLAAPELHGWWGMAPIPGMPDEAGQIARWTGGNQSSAMIFEKSANKEEGWKFLQWWLSAETQQRFGSDLEGFYGVAFRWNTANVEAFSQLPWTRDELAVLLEQWKWYKDIANIPGSYFITRELNNAWNRTVVDGMNYRESLEEAVVNLNRELDRKAREFGFIGKDGAILKTYDPPRITKPWEGVELYAGQ
jgi:ABC-type glycerol-3-phosphate transport system substrate-binding protein